MSEQRDEQAAGESRGRAVAESGRRRHFRRRTVKGETVESYLRGNSAPRYMQRLRQIETEFSSHRRRLLDAYSELREAHAHDRDGFFHLWRARAHSWSFDRLNELIREHNAWYPVEVNLPMDPRTRNFVPVHGRSYRRVELGPKWVLEHLPPEPPADRELPDVPRRAPREPLPRRRNGGRRA